MAWNSNILTSIFGRRIGLQAISSNQSGTGVSGRVGEFLVGPEDIRMDSTTADSTGTYLKAYGISIISSGNSAASAGVLRLDPPIPGVRKVISIQSTATAVASTFQWWITSSTGGGAPFIGSTWSSSFTCLSSSTPVNIQLLGGSTGQWLMFNSSGQFGSACTTST